MGLVKAFSLITLLSPLLAALLSGWASRFIGRRGAQGVSIGLTGVALIASIVVLIKTILNDSVFNSTVYVWGVSGAFHFDMGLMIDRLSSLMMVMVSFIAFLVHCYSVGYMRRDPSQPRFFSYVSLFTFMMLLLVTANNFFQLFVGWEGVGLVSYLLIGFWFNKTAAAKGSLKAFIVNRIGDFGFILGIAAILDYFGTLDYATVFSKLQSIAGTQFFLFPTISFSVMSLIGILLFVGAMGKSAQLPLHIWLPESMVGPTPISALIHAATMVTAGVFMVARLSPLYVTSTAALSLILVIGSTGALLMGLLAFVENDIKRVIAYSTMSQLGYMMAANGAAMFNVAIFHLLTHACFKALLFLSAGAVIVAMHHDQDMRHMGNLKKYMPVTYVGFLIGALALCGIPPFSGYYSKEAIIEAVQISHIPGASYAYFCLLLGAFVTGFYIFRAFFMVFHTEERMPVKMRQGLMDTPWSMRFPIIALSVPSVLLGACLAYPMLHEQPLFLEKAVTFILPKYMSAVSGWTGVIAQAWRGIASEPVGLALLGSFAAWCLVVFKPRSARTLAQYLSLFRRVLILQYGFERLHNELVKGVRWLASLFFRIGELKILDHYLVEGSGRHVNRIAQWVRRLQSGYLYHYVFIMIIALLGFLCWLVW